MPSTSNKVLFLYTSVSKIINLENKRLLYWANKINAKPYKVNGRRFIEKNDLICVLKILRERVNQDQKNVIDKLLETLL